MNVLTPLTRVLLGVFLCAPAAPGAAARPWAETTVDSRSETVETVLLRSLERPFDAPTLRSELGALGEPALEDMLRVLAHGGIRLDEQRRSLDRKHRMVLERVLATWPGSALRRSLRALASIELDTPTRTTAIGILVQAGDVGDLRLLAELASGAEPGPVLDVELQRAFQAAVTALLEQQPEAAGGLSEILRELHPSLVVATIRAVARAGDAGAPDWLANELGTLPAADQLLLLELRRIALGPGAVLGSKGRSSVRSHLAPAGAPLSIVLAAEILSSVRDVEAIPGLIPLLEHREHLVRRTALTALKSLTGQVFHYDPERWTAWYRTELAWWERDAEREIAAVRGTDPAQAAAAIRSLSARRLQPKRTVEALLPAVERPEPQIVYLACGALGQVRSDASLPALVRCLEHHDESVRVMAWTALKRLTGRHLPLDPQLWSERVLASRD